MTSSEAEDDISRSVSPDDSGGDQDEGDMAEHPEKREDGTNQNGSKSTSNAKDPLRPRRKKARRACFACQRAHLTCGMSGCFLTCHFPTKLLLRHELTPNNIGDERP